jgi:hypothetical protein
VKFFNLYQYITPIILFPLSYTLWLRQFEGNHSFVWLMLSMPILFAYIIPGLGTNWLGLWEFNTRLRLGKFRPHHGFVFGTATSLLALWCVAAPPADFGALEFLRSGFILGSVLAFWNWLYDMYAIKAGFIVVYNKPYADKLNPEAIAADYAPVLFGVFGLCYGLAIRLNQYYLLELGQWDYYGLLWIGSNVVGVFVPILVFVLYSYLKNGMTGLKAYPKNQPIAQENTFKPPAEANSPQMYIDRT